VTTNNLSTFDAAKYDDFELTFDMHVYRLPFIARRQLDYRRTMPNRIIGTI